MPSGRARRGGQAATLVSSCLLVASVMAPPALAKYASTGSGSARDKAVTLTAPAPGATFVSLSILTCTITVTWPTPVTGQQYTVIRIMNSAQTAVKSNQTASGTFSDTFLLPGLFARNIAYFIRTTTTAAGSVWTRDSSQTTVSC
ncbi:MAG: hypothetical protein JWM34_1022 [Ilumatobacteraceae bacterium]|nr:hypothetical protein [Ilumatobacteraceae bacterium]